MGETGDVPGWSIYSRHDADGQWIGEHADPNGGIDFRLSAATREELVKRIDAWASYRAANNVSERSRAIRSLS